MSKWDERYLGDGYAFGTEPNVLLSRIAAWLPTSGKALDLGTGEGRNAVFLAGQGLQVEGVDLSAVGLAKAQRLAAAKGVSITTRQADLTELKLPENSYALISCIFCHLPEPQRTILMQQCVAALQPEGLFVGVFYHPDQIGFGSGGPQNPELLATLPQMQAALSGLDWLLAEHSEENLQEGSRHQGMSSVLYLVGRKAARTS